MFSYSWNTNAVDSLNEFRAPVCDHGESAKRFLSALLVSVSSPGSFIRVEEARLELRVYIGQYIRNKLPGVPREVAAKYLDAAFDGVLNGGD